MTKPLTVVTNPIEKHFNVLSRYHYYVFFLISFSTVPLIWLVLGLIFLSPPMDFYCNNTIQKHTELLKNKCPCDDPWWDRSVFTETIQSKYDLNCETGWIISFSQSVFNVGMLIGSLSVGVLSDNYGRRLGFVLSALLLATAGCLVVAMPDSTSYVLMQILEGIGAGGFIVSGYVLLIEHYGLKHREIVTSLYHIPVNLGHVTIAGVSYMLRSCDDFQLATSAPIFIFVTYQWILFESPKWLMDSHQIDKAVTVMKKICDFNNKPCEDIEGPIQEYYNNNTLKCTSQVQMWDIFRHRQLSTRLGCMSGIYFVCGIGYYGVSQYIGKMSGNIHLNVAISGALLLPGTIASVFLLKTFGRRQLLMCTNFLSGVLMITVVFIPDGTWWRVVVACICNCFFFMSFIVVFLYGVELFPTSIRSTVLGFLSFLSRVGQISAPPINALSQQTAGLVFGVLALVSTVLCFPLPETKNTELPSTIEDTERIG